MTALDKYLASVKERAEKATPGPWSARRGTGTVVIDASPDWDHAVLAPMEAKANPEADRVFIAHSRTDVDRLVRMVEVARKLSRGIAAEYTDQTQGPSETLGKIAMRAEEYDAELDRIAASGRPRRE